MVFWKNCSDFCFEWEEERTLQLCCGAFRGSQCEVKNGGNGIKYGKLQDFCSFCANQVWFSGVVMLGVVLAKFKVSIQILGLLCSWGKLAQKSFHVYNFYFSKTGWMHLNCFLGVILSARSWAESERYFTGWFCWMWKRPMPCQTFRNGAIPMSALP